MVKIGGLNRISVAAEWIAEQLGDDGYSTDYLLDLGILSELTLQAAIPTDALTHPKDGKGFGFNMVFHDGVVDLNSLDCRGLQAQGSITLYEVESKGVLRQLDRPTTITYDDVRIKKDVLERYVAKHIGRELSRHAQTDIAPCRTNEKAVPPHSAVTPAERSADGPAWYDIEQEQGCRRMILENWGVIVSTCGNSAVGSQVLRQLKTIYGKEVKLPTLKTIQNRLIDLRKEKLIP